MFRRTKRPITPVTEEGLTKYDKESPITAIWLAWRIPGNNPEWHQGMQDEVRRLMPVLGRALDRLPN